MTDVPRVPPGRRTFARIDRFECECPNCGRLIFAGIDARFLPARLSDVSRTRAAAKQRPRAESVWRLIFNPHTQRLVCPWCDHVYTLGMVFYPVKNRGRRVLTPAPDVVPTPAEVAEMRRLGQAWFVKGGKYPEEYANLVVTSACSCPEQGTDPACPLHGEQTLRAPGGRDEPPSLAPTIPRGRASHLVDYGEDDDESGGEST